MGDNEKNSESAENYDLGQLPELPSGAIVLGKYEILDELGDGSFGRIYSAVKMDDKSKVAFKISNKSKDCRFSAYREAATLNKLQILDQNARFHIIKMLENFVLHKKHTVIILEHLGPSISDFVGEHFGCVGLPQQQIRAVSMQILEAVSFLHAHSIIHTDLKPENILMTRVFKPEEANNASPLTIRLADLNTCILEGDNRVGDVTTVYYRAPEVFLGHPWDTPIDCWSIGCIMYELATGQTLFCFEEDLPMLALMQKVIGTPLPPSLRTGGSKCDSLVSQLDNFKWTDKRKTGYLIYETAEILSDRIKGSDVITVGVLKLITGFLSWDPKLRLSCADALHSHVF